MGAQDHGAGRRRHAGPVGGAGRRLLRQGLRHHLSRPAALAGAAEGARGRPLLARAMFALAALCLLAGILPGFVIDALPGHAKRWSATACRCRRPALALDRADRRKPQLLQRPAGVRLHRALGHACRPGHPPLRLARGAPGPAWDCGFPIPSPARSTPPQLRPADPPRLRHAAVPRARDVEMPPPGDQRPARLHVVIHATSSGTGSTRRSPAPSASPPTGSTTCSS
jgi:hydrogenase-4 component B